LTIPYVVTATAADANRTSGRLARLPTNLIAGIALDPAARNDDLEMMGLI